MNENNEPCLIGYPLQKVSCVGLSSCKTKIGGFAVWHDNTTAPNEEEILCRCCGLYNKMILVAQLYAPVNVDRSLYVYCCNTRRCSLTNLGWVIIRNQDNDATSTTLVPTDILVNHTISVAKSTCGSQWDFLSETNYCMDEDLNDELTRLENDLTRVHVAAKQQNDVSKLNEMDFGKTNSKEKNGSMKHFGNVQHLPCWEIQDVEEFWSEADEVSAKLGLGVESETEYELDINNDNNSRIDNITSSISRNSHIDKLLSSYFEGEEDTGILDIVKKSRQNELKLSKSSQITKTNNNLNENDLFVSEDCDDEEEQYNDDDDDDDDFKDKITNGVATNATMMSRSSPKCQAEQYFQCRVSRYPTQVLRYAYDGKPLWISYPYPVCIGAAAAPASTSKSDNNKLLVGSPTHDDKNNVVENKRSGTAVTTKIASTSGINNANIINNRGEDKYTSLCSSKNKKKKQKKLYQQQQQHNEFKSNNMAFKQNVRCWEGNNSSSKLLLPNDDDTDAAHIVSDSAGKCKETLKNSFSTNKNNNISNNNPNTHLVTPPIETNIITIPVCELCGKQRVFECQLMPSLLSYISNSINTECAYSNDNGSINTSQCSKGNAITRDVSYVGSALLTDQLLGSGLDFGVVAIWSCPDSCYSKYSSNSSRFAIEFAVVQAPPDIA